MKILSVENLSRSFGGIKANDDISFNVDQGSILGIIGPNGAGKSTLFDLITGYTKADTGKVEFFEKNIFGLSPDKISNLGVGRTFQKLKPFADQTLLENVMIGSFVKEQNIKKARDRALEIIDFVDLIEKRHHFAKELSTGQRKRLEMARAMAIEPKLLLMDEVTGGVDQKTIPGLVELIKKLKETGVTIITIEHNINIIMEISDNVLALDQGKSIAFGTPKEIQKNKEVISLNLINRKIEKEERQSWALGIENKRRASLNLEIFSSYKAMEDFNDAKETQDDEKEFDIDLDNDYLLNEGTQILSDYTIHNHNSYLSKAA